MYRTVMYISLTTILMLIMTVTIPYSIILNTIVLLSIVVVKYPLEKSLNWLWYGIVISSFFGSYLGIPGNESIFLFRILILTHGILFIFGYKKKRAYTIEFKLIFLGLLLWIVTFIVTLFWSMSVMVSLRYIYYIIELSYLIFLSVYYINSKVNLKKFTRILTVIYVLQILIGLFETLLGVHLPNSGALVYETMTSEFQPTGLLFNTNDYAFFLAIFFPIIFIDLIANKSIGSKILLIFITMSSFYLVVSTYSRLGMVIFTLEVIILLIVKYKIISIFIGSCMTLLITFVLLVFPIMFTKLNTIIYSSFTDKGSSTSDRMERYEMLLEMIKNSNLKGVGAGISPIKLREYRLGYGQLQHSIAAPHNFWLELIADGGVFGLIPISIFLGICLASIYFFVINFRSEVSILAVVPAMVYLVFFVSGVALSTIIDKRYLWIAVGTATAILNIMFNMRKDK